MDIEDDILKKVTGGDGTLPGGMPPEMLKQLMSSPEVMELLSNPKMQEVMSIMMEGGQDAIEVAMIEDKEVYELVTKLNEVMGKAM
jgi:predicted transcriptional regulator|eukprot:scaffold12097_cov328-Chaetoceros_neogracile.AAC.1